MLIILSMLALLMCYSAVGADRGNKISYQKSGPEETSASYFLEENDINTNTSFESPVDQGEDEDNSKEKVFHRLASLNFSNLSRQHYLCQHSIFQQIRLEIETPPPRHS